MFQEQFTMLVVDLVLLVILLLVAKVAVAVQDKDFTPHLLIQVAAVEQMVLMVVAA